MPTECIMHAGLVLSAHAHNIEYYGLVKVVNNAKWHTFWLSRSSAETASGVLADITKSPIFNLVWVPAPSQEAGTQTTLYSMYNQGLMGSISPSDTTKQQQKQIYRLRNVRTGYVLYRALVFCVVIFFMVRV